jgi:hypothetical protein
MPQLSAPCRNHTHGHHDVQASVWVSLHFGFQLQRKDMTITFCITRLYRLVLRIARYILHTTHYTAFLVWPGGQQNINDKAYSGLTTGISPITLGMVE